MSDDREQTRAEDLEQQPDLPVLLEEVMKGSAERIHAAMPGIIRAVNATTGRVSVQPSIKKSGEDEEPVIPDVPVLQLRVGAAKVTLPVAVNDPVLLIYADRSLDEWAGDGGSRVVTAADPRAHDATDCWALPFGPGSFDALNLVLTCSALVLLGGSSTQATNAVVGASAAAQAAIAALVTSPSEPVANAIVAALKLLLFSTKVKVA